MHWSHLANTTLHIVVATPPTHLVVVQEQLALIILVLGLGDFGVYAGVVPTSQDTHPAGKHTTNFSNARMWDLYAPCLSVG